MAEETKSPGMDWNPISNLAGSLVGTVAGIFQNRANRRFEAQQASLQRDWNERMMTAQNQWNLEQWQREMEYNTPSAQVSRLRDAGLNPLFYGLDGNSTNAPMSAQPLGYDRASVGNQPNPLELGLDTASQIASLALTEAQKNKVRSETNVLDAKLPYEIDNLRSQIRNSDVSSDAQEIINQYLDRQQEAEIRLKTSSAAAADKSIEKMAADISKMDYEKTTMFISWLETSEKILNLQKTRELNDKQIEELSSLIRKNNAEADKIGLDISNYDDITVLGTANTNFRFGPLTIAQGEPITLGMKKLAEKHMSELKSKIKSKVSSKKPTNRVFPYDLPVSRDEVYDTLNE